MFMLYIWLAVICVGLIVEFIDAGSLVSVWVSVGAIIPLLMSFWKNYAVWYITLQVVIFGIITLLCMVFLRRICKKLLFGKTDGKTNMDVLIGKTFKIKVVRDEVMYVKINGIEYKAILENENGILEVGEEVEIVKFSGNKIIVKRV